MATDKKNILNDFTQNFIETYLKERDLVNYSIGDVTFATVPGDNYLGVLFKVPIIYKDDNKGNTKLNLVIKVAPKNEVLRKAINLRELYNREIFVYREIFPVFRKIQQENEITNLFDPFAKYCTSSMEDLNETLVMEDMKELGFKLCDRKKPLDNDHVLLTLREYAKLHAISFALRDQNPELFEQLGKNMEDVLHTDLRARESKAGMKPYIDRAAATLDPITDRSAFEKFESFRINFSERVAKAVYSETAGKYAVFIHGDCWINNILYKYNNNKKPSEVCFLDWQLARLGSPVLDLSYFILACTSKEMRDQHYKDWIKEYYNSFSSFLTEFGSDPEKLFPYDVLLEHLKKFSVYGLYMAIFVLYFMSSESDEVPVLGDNDGEEKLQKAFSFKTKNVALYNERIRGVILNITEWDYEF